MADPHQQVETLLLKTFLRPTEFFQIGQFVVTFSTPIGGCTQGESLIQGLPDDFSHRSTH
jgi:hypothetical protein